MSSLDNLTQAQAAYLLQQLMFEDFLKYAPAVLKVQTTRGRIVPFTLNRPQMILHTIIERYIKPYRPVRIIGLKSRRMGFSTYFSGRYYWKTSRKPNRYAAQITHEPEATDALFKMSKRFYDFSPPEHKPETKYNNTRLLEFNTKDGQGLNSGFRVATAGKEDFGSGQLIHYCHLCMAPDTPVLIADGREKMVCDVQVGDTVVTHHGNTGKVVAVSKTQSHELPDNGAMVVVHPWLGSPIHVTPQHKVWTNMGWVQAGDLDPHWHMVSMPIREITHGTKSLPISGRKSKYGPAYKGPTEFALNEETGFAIGYYLAEGCLSRTVGGADTYHRIIFTLHQDEDAFAKRACDALAPFCKSPAKIKDRPNTQTKNYTVDSGVLANFIGDNFGRVDEKRIPDWVFDCGEDFCRGLVFGYLAGDGSKGIGGTHQNYESNSLSATSIRESVTYQVRDLVAALGYGWGNVKSRPGGIFYGRNCRAAWTVHFNGECGRKLREGIGIPFAESSEHTLSGQRYRMDFQNKKVWIKIKKITKSHCDEVYDLAIDHDDHSFRTPHFAVSNSEVSKWESGNIESLLTSILQCVPDDPESEVAFESTAKGMGGVFYDRFWGARYRIFVKSISPAGNPVIEQTVNEDAPPDNNYTSIFLPWFVFEEYQMQLPPGFVLTTEEATIKRKHGLTDEQMYWRRYTIANKCDGKVEIFQQEYPACIVGTARVGTAKGMLRLADLGAHVGTETEFGTIKAFYPKGKKPVYRLRTSLGYEIVGTLDHPVSTEDGFVDLGDCLGKNVVLAAPSLASDYCTVPLDLFPFVNASVTIDEDFARFIGYFMGDGSYCDDTLSIVCDNKDQDVVADVTYLVEKYFGTPGIRAVGSEKGGVEIRLSRRNLRELFSQLGLIRRDRGGNVKRKVCVPGFIWESPRSVIREFLRGLFEADGFADYQQARVVLFCKEEGFLQEIQLLMLALGVPCKYSESQRKNGKGFEYIARELVLRAEECKLFVEHIGFVSSRKSHRILGYLNNPLRAKYSRKDRVLGACGVDEVVSITPAGEEEVYDITVEGVPHFSANGIVVHNCPQEAFIGSGRPVFDVVKLAALRETLPKPIARYDLITTTGQWVARPDGRLRVWEEPSVRKAYIIGADVAEGLKEGDFSVADVIDHRTGKQVAQWHGKMSAMDFSKVLIALGQRYNEAFIACERNNHGYTVNEALGNSSYPNSRIYTEPRPEFPHKSRKRLGWVTSNATRPMMIDNLMQEVNEDSHGIVCMETIDEMMTFSIQDNGRMEADVGRKDDRVMSYAIAKKVRQKVPLPAFNQNPHFKKLDTTGRTERKVDRKAWM